MMRFLFGGFLFPLALAVYRPQQGSKFQWQLQINSNHHFDYSMTADVYDTDLWAITPHDIQNIHRLVYLFYHSVALS